MSAVCTVETHGLNTMTNVAVKQLPDLSTNVPVHTYMVVWIVAGSTAPLTTRFGSVQSRRICHHVSARGTLRSLLNTHCLCEFVILMAQLQVTSK